MQNTPGIFLGKGDKSVYLNPRYANRHGLIAGATGTGKTVSLQILAEAFSADEQLKARAQQAAASDADGKSRQRRKSPRRSNRQGIFEALMTSVARAVGSTLGRRISRGILGSLLK